MRSEAPKLGDCTRGMFRSPYSGSAGMHSSGRANFGSARDSGWQIEATLRSPQVRFASGPCASRSVVTCLAASRNSASQLANLRGSK